MNELSLKAVREGWTRLPACYRVQLELYLQGHRPPILTIQVRESLRSQISDTRSPCKSLFSSCPNRIGRRSPDTVPYTGGYWSPLPLPPPWEGLPNRIPNLKELASDQAIFGSPLSQYRNLVELLLAPSEAWKRHEATHSLMEHWSVVLP